MSIAKPKTLFFCGIGGSGMSSLAQVLKSWGYKISGSDRDFDRKLKEKSFTGLLDQGIQLWPQDGSGISDDTDELVVSSAVEESIPDVRAAMRHGIPVRKRAEVLAEVFNHTSGIAVGGTSGKSTVTGMIAHILTSSGADPTVVNGGVMLDAARAPFLGNAICGNQTNLVIEADESDGSIALYRPGVSVITNISTDHKPLSELHHLFRDFSIAAKTACVLNRDCPESSKLQTLHSNSITFGLDSPDADLAANDIRLNKSGVSFKLKSARFRLPILGRHNVSNALAAIGACKVLGISVGECAESLRSFQGIERRLQVIGNCFGVTIIDDFAHNPEKIKATLSTLRRHGNRLLVMYQPHGYAPTKFVRDGLINVFSSVLIAGDLLAMPDIFYVGGTAVKSITSQDLIAPVARSGIDAHHIRRREDIARWFLKECTSGDVIVIMGARDESLSTFARHLLAELRERSAN